MITIKTVEWAGGACPYQIEGVTDDGQYFYLRYRMGCLRAGVAKTHAEFWNNPNPYNIIYIECGEEFEGWAYHEDMEPLLKDLIKFPDGFRIESYTEEEIKSWPKPGEDK